MWRFGRFRACFGLGFLCFLFTCLQNVLVLYHTTLLWLHLLVFGTDNGLHAVSFFLLVFGLSFQGFLSFLFLSLFCRAFGLGYGGVDLC